MNASNKFDDYYNFLILLSKKDIIMKGQKLNVWANLDSTTKELMKWNRLILAKILADRMVRKDLRGY